MPGPEKWASAIRRFSLPLHGMKQNRLNILMAALLILMAAGSRIVNHEIGQYNLAPVAALGLFSGAIVKDKRLAFLFTLLAQLLSDVYFQLFTSMQGFYPSMIFTYAGMFAVTLLGTQMGAVKAHKVLGFAVGGSVLFFLISNFGVWAEGYYGYTAGGLLTCFVQGIPFYRNTLIGDVAGSTLLFGGYHLLQLAVAGRMRKAAL
jgi:hypothetical protein